MAVSIHEYPVNFTRYIFLTYIKLVHKWVAIIFIRFAVDPNDELSYIVFWKRVDGDVARELNINVHTYKYIFE